MFSRINCLLILSFIVVRIEGQYLSPFSYYSPQGNFLLSDFPTILLKILPFTLGSLLNFFSGFLLSVVYEVLLRFFNGSQLPPSFLGSRTRPHKTPIKKLSLSNS